MANKKELKSNSLRNKITAAVIAGIILLIFKDYLFPKITSSVSIIWKYLVSKNSVPNWLTIILVLFSLKLIFNSIRKIFRTIDKEAPPWHVYRKDRFYGLDWEWMYDWEGDIARLVAYCPKCKVQFDTPMNTYWGNPFAPKCDYCGYTSIEMPSKAHDIKRNVTKLIHRNIKEGHWKLKVVNRVSNS